MAKILVVDDVPDNVKLLTYELEEQGHDVIAATSGRRALGVASAEFPDAILLDVMMPEMDGIEVCRRLKEDAHTRTIPILLVTAKGLDEHVVAGLDAGADDYVPKPFSSEVLAARVRSALRIKESYDAVERTNELLREEIVFRKRTAEALKKRELELHQAEKLKAVGQLAGGIAHEFNNLLQAIQGYTKYAMEDLPPDSQRRQDLQQVLEASGRAAVLTRGLLDFGSRRALARQRVDLNQLVADLKKMIHPLMGRQIEVELKLGQDVGTVHADPQQLQQVLLNLCLNARDAMPSGGELLVTTESLTENGDALSCKAGIPPGRYVVLSVTDNGCGMTPAVQQRVFEPFFTSKDVGEGVGLGLATAYGIVQEHGGDIRVDSQPGKKTVFRVYLPAHQQASAVDQSPAAELIDAWNDATVV